MADANGSVLRLQGVAKVYGEKVKTHALRGVDLEVRPGEVLGYQCFYIRRIKNASFAGAFAQQDIFHPRAQIGAQPIIVTGIGALTRR